MAALRRRRRAAGCVSAVSRRAATVFGTSGDVAGAGRIDGMIVVAVHPYHVRRA